MNFWAFLTSRTVIKISGLEARSFLHGLATQDILSERKPVFSALLNAQGRFQSDFFVVLADDGVLIDCDEIFKPYLMETLSRVAPLHGVSVHDMGSQYAVCAAWGEDISSLFPLSEDLSHIDTLGRIFYKDPRHSGMGIRALAPYAHLHDLPTPTLNIQTASHYHAHRICTGVPEGSHDLVAGKSIILEYGYHFIHAISWDKGCYIGQELMARTFHQGQIRKRLCRIVLIQGKFPPKGSDLFHQEHRIGSMGGHQENKGLASVHISLCDPHTPVTLSWQDDNLYGFVEPLF